MTPTVPCCTQNFQNKRKYAPNAADWTLPTWRALDFSIDEPFRFPDDE